MDEPLSALDYALQHIGPAPCETCLFVDYCADGFACRAYTRYANEANNLRYSQRHDWVPLAFLPDRRHYDLVFGKNDPTLRTINAGTAKP